MVAEKESTNSKTEGTIVAPRVVPSPILNPDSKVHDALRVSYSYSFLFYLLSLSYSIYCTVSYTLSYSLALSHIFIHVYI